LAVVILVIVVAVAGSKGGRSPEQSARAYIETVQGDTSEVQDSVKAAQVVIASAISSPTSGKLHRLAQGAQTAYEEINSVHGSFAHPDTGNGLGKAQSELFTAAEGLRNAMRSFVTYAGNPTPSARAQAATGYRRAMAEWDRATTAIWRIASLRDPPTVS
jgi:hypothetical protein